MSARDLYGISTVLFLDEIHRFTKAQQDALLPGRRERLGHPRRGDDGEPVVLGDLAAAVPLAAADPRAAHRRGPRRLLVDRAVSDPRGTRGKVELEPDARAAIVRLASGDARARPHRARGRRVLRHLGGRMAATAP